MTDILPNEPKQFKFLTSITVLFVAVLMISNLAATKILGVAGFDLDGGTILFPLTYIFGDVLTEVYGFRRARSVIWHGFAASILMSATFLVVGLLPSSPNWSGQEAYNMILGFVPRIVAASLIAYFCGEFTNSFILAKLKVLTQGKKLWARTIGSTVAGELVDTLLFVGIAFYGIIPNEALVGMVIANYVFKTGVEVLLTPVTYKVVAFLKNAEHEDYYDRDTNFNPFAVK